MKTHNEKSISQLRMSAILVASLTLSLPVLGSPTDHCHVIGNTGDNNLSAPMGSQSNPYGSLADVEANPDCKKITVLYSDTALDGYRANGRPATDRQTR